ncbi:MAG: hypothetical protein JJU36_02170 [Phycisphaeraceae bacterium]|nr:hypothetical protein [Phycisphaeraceae bacterium]
MDQQPNKENPGDGEPSPREGLSIWSIAGIELILVAFLAVVLLWPLNFEPRAGRPILSLDNRPIAALAGMFMLFLPMGAVWWKLLGQPVIGEFYPAWLMRQRVMMVAVDLGLYVFALELLQAWVPERQSSLLDALAGLIGALLGAIIADALFGRQTPSPPEE